MRLYAYCDETGQDTYGEFFWVVTVIVGQEGGRLLAWLEEKEGKIRELPRGARRLGYIERVIGGGRLPNNSIYFSVYKNTTEYRTCTIESIARALTAKAGNNEYQAFIIVDGLPKEEVKRFAKDLRARGIHARVRGISDQANAFVRLADRAASFIRDAQEWVEGLTELFAALHGSVIHEC